MLKAFRSALVMTGYFMPMDDEISLGLVTIGLPDAAVFQIVMADIGDVFPATSQDTVDKNPFADRLYPHLFATESDGRTPAEFHSPWLYPAGQPTENEATIAGPYPRRANPNVLFQPVATNAAVRDQLETSPSPQWVDQNARALLRVDTHLGDATSFSAYQIWLHTRAARNRHTAKTSRTSTGTSTPTGAMATSPGTGTEPATRPSIQTRTATHTRRPAPGRRRCFPTTAATTGASH